MARVCNGGSRSRFGGVAKRERKLILSIIRRLQPCFGGRRLWGVLRLLLLLLCLRLLARRGRDVEQLLQRDGGQCPRRRRALRGRQYLST
jgi:hypothetical protein